MTERPENTISNRAIYCPPWRERMADGSLGPWYGPHSISQYLRARRERRANDGKPASRESRIDADKMHRYMASHGHAVPTRELEIYVALYVDERSVASTARRFKIKRDTVKGLLGRLRRRLVNE